MRTVLSVVALLTLTLAASPAVAQELGEAAVISETTSSIRFVDADVPGPIFNEGDAVILLYRVSGQSRVRKGNQYGWIPSTAMADPATMVDDTQTMDDAVPMGSDEG